MLVENRMTYEEFHSIMLLAGLIRTKHTDSEGRTYYVYGRYASTMRPYNMRVLYYPFGRPAASRSKRPVIIRYDLAAPAGSGWQKEGDMELHTAAEFILQFCSDHPLKSGYVPYK